MRRIIINDYVDATLAGLCVTIVLVVVTYALFEIRKALIDPERTAMETGSAQGAEGRRKQWINSESRGSGRFARAV